MRDLSRTTGSSSAISLVFMNGTLPGPRPMRELIKSHRYQLIRCAGGRALYFTHRERIEPGSADFFRTVRILRISKSASAAVRNSADWRSATQQIGICATSAYAAEKFRFASGASTFHIGGMPNETVAPTTSCLGIRKLKSGKVRRNL